MSEGRNVSSGYKCKIGANTDPWRWPLRGVRTKGGPNHAISDALRIRRGMIRPSALGPNGAVVNSQGWRLCATPGTRAQNVNKPQRGARIGRPVTLPGVAQSLHPWLLTAAPSGLNPMARRVRASVI